MESRNATIEFYRYIFMVVLLMWHGPFDSFKFKNGYLGKHSVNHVANFVN